jgi:hypothetical protein
MASTKRPAFSFPELERRGRRTILRSAEEVNAEIEALENPEPTLEVVEERIKVTYRFTSAAVEAVEDIRRILRRRHGIRKATREDIAQIAVLEALRTLEDTGADSFVARHFDSNSLS